jgi:predicted permease
MTEILSTIVPIFLVIAVGYCAVRQDYVPKTHIRSLGLFVVKIAIPALLLKAFSQRAFAEIMDVRYLAAYTLGSLAVFGAGLCWARFARGRDMPASAMLARGMAASNSGFIGYPIAQHLLGAPAGLALSLNMLVENALILPLSFVLAERASTGGASLRQVVSGSIRSLATNPLIVSIAAGFLLSLSGLRLPAPVLALVDMLAMASTPTALFVIGGTLVGLRIGGMLADLLQVVGGKLLLHPLAVFAALLLFPALNAQLKMAALTFACMPMLGIYPILGQKYRQEQVCAAALMAATSASVLSIALVLWAVRVSGVMHAPGPA